MANRLAASTSPYLRQHQDNPVDWFEWGTEAFDAARAAAERMAASNLGAQLVGAVGVVVARVLPGPAAAGPRGPSGRSDYAGGTRTRTRTGPLATAEPRHAVCAKHGKRDEPIEHIDLAALLEQIVRLGCSYRAAWRADEA